MIQLGEHFKTDDRSRHSDWLRQQRWFIKSKHEQVRRDDIADKQEQSMLSLAADIIMATEIQIEKFKVKLDAYDEATVKALMENSQALDLINAQLEEMLERAYVMEDGRRVFKTEDGTQVFDEFGKEVLPDELDFAAIDPESPTWESYQPIFSEREQLLVERRQILEFQEKVDAARERVDGGDISKTDLDELDADLLEIMPSSVKAHVPGFDTSDNAPAVKTAFTANAKPAILENPVNPSNDWHLQL
ncbi:MAG: hypothetical protein JKY52_20070 [Flavobacteriales bacterium]|nr:hypothetical protein [Flavobacteriales bacterium]